MFLVNLNLMHELKNFFVIILNLIVVILYNFGIIVDNYLQVLYYELIIVIKMMEVVLMKFDELYQLIHWNSIIIILNY